MDQITDQLKEDIKSELDHVRLIKYDDEINIKLHDGVLVAIVGNVLEEDTVSIDSSINTTAVKSISTV